MSTIFCSVSLCSAVLLLKGDPASLLLPDVIASVFMPHCESASLTFSVCMMTPMEPVTVVG